MRRHRSIPNLDSLVIGTCIGLIIVAALGDEAVTLGLTPPMAGPSVLWITALVFALISGLASLVNSAKAAGPGTEPKRSKNQLTTPLRRRTFALAALLA
jgi:hypothetical protein